MLSAAEIEQLPDEVKNHITGLAEINRNYEARISEQELEIEDLQEQLKLARFRKFARSSESAEELLQAMLFEEAEIQSVPPDEPETDRSLTTVASHTRKKRGRKPLSDDLPTVEVIHDIPEAQKRCACGHELSKVDEEVSEKLKTIPEQFFRRAAYQAQVRLPELRGFRG
jgi:transposase